MGTRSDIIIKRPGVEEYASIYCHWDGYPSHNGRILRENYTTHDEVVALIQLGGLSSLRESLSDTISYHGWRGEEIEILVTSNLRDHTNQSYSYLFKDGEWWFTGYNGHGGWKKLIAEICSD
jgi:hypothetical protein